MMIFMRSAKFLLVLFVCIVFCAPAQAGVQITDDTVGKIDELVSSKIPWTGYTPSYSILIDQGGKIVYERNIGYTDIGNRVPATRRSEEHTSELQSR